MPDEKKKRETQTGVIDASEISSPPQVLLTPIVEDPATSRYEGWFFPNAVKTFRPLLAFFLRDAAGQVVGHPFRGLTRLDFSPMDTFYWIHSTPGLSIIEREQPPRQSVLLVHYRRFGDPIVSYSGQTVPADIRLQVQSFDTQRIEHSWTKNRHILTQPTSELLNHLSDFGFSTEANDTFMSASPDVLLHLGLTGGDEISSNLVDGSRIRRRFF